MLNSTNLLFLSIEYVRGKTWTGITVLVTITSSVCHSTNNFLGAAEIKKPWILACRELGESNQKIMSNGLKPVMNQHQTMIKTSLVFNFAWCLRQPLVWVNFCIVWKPFLHDFFDFNKSFDLFDSTFCLNIIFGVWDSDLNKFVWSNFGAAMLHKITCQCQ